MNEIFTAESAMPIRRYQALLFSSMKTTELIKGAVTGVAFVQSDACTERLTLTKAARAIPMLRIPSRIKNMGLPALSCRTW
jgi:hypothetical protein